MAGYPDYLSLDVETTGATNDTYGNPFTDSNRLVSLGHGTSDRAGSVWLLDPQDVPSNSINTIQQILAGPGSSLVVGFNLKFDLHWLRRYGCPVRSPVWDCQLAEFILTDQTNPFPSLEDTVAKYGLGEKYVDIETEYWNQGIDTDQIPYEIVKTRVESDIIITSRLFELQIDELKKHPNKKKLIWVACQDLLTLQEMEWNGLKYDLQLSVEEGNKIRKEQEQIRSRLTDLVPIPQINWGSGDHLSAVLYGGILAYDDKEDYVFVYKDGRTKLKTRKKRFEIPMERRVEPLPRSELAKEGYFSTSEPTLLKLRPADKETKEIIRLVQQFNKLDKRVGTYYHGLPKLYEEFEWTNSTLHGNLNTCATATGRLSSTKPNQQNMDHEIRRCIVSRYQ